MSYKEQAFIAYQGTDYGISALENTLKKYKNSSHTVKLKQSLENDIKFAKVVYDNYNGDRDPYYMESVLAVGGYDNEILNSKNETTFSKYDISDQDRNHTLINYLFSDFGKVTFEKLSSHMDYSTAIFSTDTKEFVAGRGNGSSNNSSTNLFYGYTRSNEIMFSNYEDVLRDLCSDIHEFPLCSYYENGEFISYDSRYSPSKVETKPLISNSPENAKTLIDGLNSLLFGVANEGIKDQITNYLGSGETKQMLSNYLDGELSGQALEELLKLIKNTIQELDVKGTLEDTLYNKFDEILNKYALEKKIPIVHIIKLNETELGRTGAGHFHEKFEDILTQTQLDEPVC